MNEENIGCVQHDCAKCKARLVQPERPWVGLMDEELQLIYDMGRTYAGMMDMVEAKLKEKNT